MVALLLKGGRVVDPASGIDAEMDVLIEDGKIKSVAKAISREGASIISAKGKLVFPGLIDMHAHLRDPGNPEEETIASGTEAAALGGFTSVCSMANTNPVNDNPAVTEYIYSKAELEGIVNVFPIAAVTKGLRGEEITEMGRLIECGVVAFSDDGNPIMNSEVLRHALEYARQFNVPIISHCEDINLSKFGMMNEGTLSTILGLRPIPALAEEIMVGRDIMLAKEFGRIHIAHVSTAGSVELIRRAKKEGINITCETCPHYFTLTETAVENYNTNAKVNPPLRSEKDVAAILSGLKDGTIDVIATDHAPHIIEEKNIEFGLASPGISGLETALSLVLTELVGGVLPLKGAIEKLTVNPAKILSLKRGNLKVGGVADVIVVDPNLEYTVDVKKFASKGKNSPFDGWKLKGKVLYTIVSGKIVVKDGSRV